MFNIDPDVIEQFKNYVILLRRGGGGSHIKIIAKERKVKLVQQDSS